MALQLAELGLHLLAQLLIQRRERLVEQQHARPHHQRARQCHALALAAGEGGGRPRAIAAEVDHLQRLVDARLGLRAADANLAQPVADVLADVQVREDRIALEDHVGRAVVCRHACHVLPVDPDSAGCRLLEAGDAAQKRGLAAARWPEQREELALADLGRDAVERHDVAEALVDVAKLDQGARLAHSQLASAPRAAARRRKNSAVISRPSDSNSSTKPSAMTLGSLAMKRSWLQM